MPPSKERLLQVVAGASLLLAATAFALALFPPRFVDDWLRVRRARHRAIASVNAVPFRRIEGRLSLDFEHRPLRRRARGADPRTRAEQTAMEALDAMRSAVSDLAKDDEVVVGPLSLLQGDSARAVVDLERRMCRRPEESIPRCIERSTDTALLIDLACAYDHRAQGPEAQPDDVLLAAAAARRASSLEPESAAAAWNRALTVERLGLVHEARQLWQAYLRVEDSSGWADEARARLAILDAPTYAERWAPAKAELESALGRGERARIETIAQGYPMAVLGVLEKEWLGRWAGSVENRKTAEADRQMLGMLAAAAGLERAGDRLAADSLDALRESPQLAGPIARWDRARQALRSRGTQPAIAAMNEAIAGLQGSPFEIAAIVEVAGLQQHAGDYTEAKATAEHAGARIDPQRWPILAAKVHWIRGAAMTSLGRTSRAREAYLRAMEQFHRAGDRSQDGMIEMLLADNADLAGNVGETWRRHLRAVQAIERSGESGRALVVLDTFTRAALRRGQFGFADLLNDVLMQRARSEQNAPYLCHVLITRADVLIRTGRAADARHVIDEARAIWSGIADEAIRKRLETDLALAAASAVIGGERLQELSRAVDVAVERHDLYRITSALFLRAQELRREGMTASARRDLEKAILVTERQRATLEAIPDKITYFETARAIAEELVDLHLQQGSHEEALQVVERVRARLLVDRLARGGVAPAPVGEIRSGLDPGIAIVEYWTKGDSIQTWILRREGVRFTRLPASRRAVVEAARHLQSAMEEGDAWEEPAAFLLRALVTPLEPHLAGVTRLVIVQDETIPEIPHGVLFDPQQRRFLVERFAISVSASATALSVSRPLTKFESALVVANPIAPRDLSLLDVRAEVAAIARAMPRARVYERKEATLSALRGPAADADTVHLATHGFADEGASEAMLVFSPEEGNGDGLIPASEIETLSVRPGALVVLAACRTARGKSSSEGTLSIARAFLGAGAGQVVAALWDVEDEETSRLFRRFYANVREGAPPVTALQEAQRSLLAENRDAHPGRWAGFQVYGGGMRRSE